MLTEIYIVSAILQFSAAASCLFLPNLSLEGGNYDEFDASDKMMCCIACSNHKCCVGYSYSKELKRCYMKSAINYSEENHGFISGLKPNSEEAPGKAAFLKNVKIEGTGIDPVKFDEHEECKQYCNVFGIYSWTPARKVADMGKGSCVCMSRIHGMKYEHGCKSFISPPTEIRL